MTSRSVAMGWGFPRWVMEQCDHYLTFRSVSEGDLAESKGGLTELVQKPSFRYEKPLVIKSPAYTCRIKLVLELFPGAKFVHIRRNPYHVFQSMIYLMHAISPWISLQQSNLADLKNRTIEQYKEVYESFFEERDLIPGGHFTEIGFEDLETDPIRQMRSIYQWLSLPDFGHIESDLTDYLRSLEGYKKNTFPELAVEVREQVA